MFSTELAYGATQCLVLSSRMVLPGQMTTFCLCGTITWYVVPYPPTLCGYAPTHSTDNGLPYPPPYPTPGTTYPIPLRQLSSAYPVAPYPSSVPHTP
eukprot:461620-Rhodomonas_salina.1